MDATTTPSTNSLIDAIAADFPQLHFVADEDFGWNHAESTIAYNASDEHFSERLLHELGHATMEHSSYSRDIDLIAMERDAWQKAKVELGPAYGISIDSDVIENDLDTYRDWLHSRSTCPSCQSNGIQTAKQSYKCLACRHEWRVNEARSCALRRYSHK